jgi:hypothetical protein
MQGLVSAWPFYPYNYFALRGTRVAPFGLAFARGEPGWASLLPAVCALMDVKTLAQSAEAHVLGVDFNLLELELRASVRMTAPGQYASLIG